MLDVGRSAGPNSRALAALDYSVLQQCMHCGLCLPSCPTFAETGRERNSPRGRISLLRAVADQETPFSRAIAEEMDYCLGCLACTTACPAGVDYTAMFEAARAETERRGLLATPRRSWIRRLTLRGLFVYPRLLRLVGRFLWLYQAAGLQRMFRALRFTALLPAQVRELERNTPAVRAQFSDTLIAEVETPRLGRPRHRVALLTGCVADLLFSDINRATVDVLLENGCEVITPRAQNCCGSLHAHNGDPETARVLARRQLDTLDPCRFDAIISNAGGCGSHLKHYDTLLADDPRYAARAVEWSRKVKDISEWLVEIGFRAPRAAPEHPTSNIQHRTSNARALSPQQASKSQKPDAPAAESPTSRLGTSTLDVGCSMLGVGDTSAAASRPLTYHESCHLCHGQKISAPPRALLKSLPGFELRECTEASWCCGSAGVYSLTQPRTATWLRDRKVGHLHATQAEVVVTGNPGCHLQIENGLRAAGDARTRVTHPIVLLAEAYRNERARRA